MEPGSTIGQYEIVSRLGGGGMGVVYKARDTKLDRLVALKFLPPELSEDESANARFMQEARAASALDHPNICTIYDIRETDDGRLYIVMAYYDGQTLKYRLKDDALDAEETVEITHQIALGLGAAHDAGIVHRDIKPANIMVTDSGLVKILDFGIAKLGAGTDLTKTGSTVGTVYYMSPEQIKGESVDQRTDLWSLGVVSYQMLTGKRPFDGEYDQAVSYAIVHSEPPELPAGVPRALGEITFRLLQKEPSKRPASAAEVAAEIEADGAGAGLRNRTSAAKWRWMALGIFVALASAGVWMASNSRVADSNDDRAALTGPVVKDNTIAIMPFAVGGGEDIAYLEESMVDLLSLGMQGAGDLQTVDPNTIFGLLQGDRSVVRDPGRARVVAAQLGAGRFVLGGVAQLGPQIRINASLYDSDGQLLQQAEAMARGEEHLAAMVDTLVVQLIAGQVSDPLKEFIPMATQTSPSFPALKAYLRGEYAYRQGKFDEGGEALREAIALDSTFALPLLRIRDWNPSPEWHQRLVRHRDKLPERERMLARALTEPHDSFEELADRVLEVTRRYPNYAHAWFKIGDMVYHNAYQDGMMTSDARPYLDRALRLDPNNAEVIGHLITLAMQERDFSLVDSLAEISPDDHPIETQVGIAWRNDQLAIDSLFRHWRDPETPANWGPWIVALNSVKHLEDAPFALRVLDTQLGKEPPGSGAVSALVIVAEAARGRFYAFDSLMTQWNRERGPGLWTMDLVTNTCLECPVHKDYLSRLAEGIDTFDQIRPGNFFYEERLEIKAFANSLVFFRLDDLARFNESRNQVTQIAADKGKGSLAQSMADILDALWYWANGNIPMAIEAIGEGHKVHDFHHELSSVFHNHTLARYLRAEFLFADGKYRDALPWFASLVEGGMHVYWSLPYQGPSLLRRAQIYEQLGQTDKAAEFYRRFLKLWQDADPEVAPLIEDARQSLDRLIEMGVREPQPG